MGQAKPIALNFSKFEIQKSPFNISGINMRATTKDILDAIKNSRSRI
jgi:hypothetical protein